MKILFIQIYIGGSDPPFYSEGIGSIAAVLKNNNIKVSLFCFYSWNNIDALKETIISYKPDVIAFSALNCTFKSIKKIASFIKKQFPKIITVCGGVHITLNPGDFYRTPSLDAICLGEGEYSFLEFLKKLEKKGNYYNVRGFWTRKNNKIIKNPRRETIENIDELPFGDRSIFLEQGDLWRTEAFGKAGEKGLEFCLSRGCPFECTYCCNHALKKFYGPNYIRFKSPSRAIEEIKFITKKYRHDFIIFLDDIFTLDKKWLFSFLDKYKKIKIPFACNARVETCTKEIFDKLKEAGCRLVLIGLESGDYDLRKNILNRPMTNNQLINTFKLARESGLKTLAFVMIGLPEETPKKFMNTVKIMSVINPDAYGLLIFNPYPGTELFKICKKKKLFSASVKKELLMERCDSILNIPAFSREDILYYYQNFDFLIDVGKKRYNLMKEIHRIILYFLLSKPPSHKLFFAYQVLLNVDRALMLFIKNMLRIKKKTYCDFTSSPVIKAPEY